MATIWFCLVAVMIAYTWCWTDSIWARALCIYWSQRRTRIAAW